MHWVKLGTPHNNEGVSLGMTLVLSVTIQNYQQKPLQQLTLHIAKYEYTKIINYEKYINMHRKAIYMLHNVSKHY